MIKLKEGAKIYLYGIDNPKHFGWTTCFNPINIFEDEVITDRNNRTRRYFYNKPYPLFEGIPVTSIEWEMNDINEQVVLVASFT
jgi:hypothetical protein